MFLFRACTRSFTNKVLFTNFQNYLIFFNRETFCHKNFWTMQKRFFLVSLHTINNLSLNCSLLSVATPRRLSFSKSFYFLIKARLLSISPTTRKWLLCWYNFMYIYSSDWVTKLSSCFNLEINKLNTCKKDCHTRTYSSAFPLCFLGKFEPSNSINKSKFFL